MPITILDYVKSVVGDKDLYTAEDCLASGVDILGGCQGCGATIAATTPTPPPPGTGAAPTASARTDSPPSPTSPPTKPPPAACPACGNTDTISETRITTGERAEEYALECGDCGEVWQP